MTVDRRQLNRYIAWSAAVLLVIAAGILVWLNAAFASRNRQRTSVLLQVILQSAGEPEKLEDPDDETAMELAAYTGTNASATLAMSSYYLAWVEPDGNVRSLSLDHAVEISEGEAVLMTESAFEEGLSSGRVNQYAYLWQADGNGRMYAFVNVAEDIVEGIWLTTASIALGCLAGGLILAFVGVSAARVVYPALRRCAGGAELMRDTADRLAARENAPDRAAERIIETLETGAAVLEGRGQICTFSLSDLVPEACAASIPEAGERLDLRVAPGVFVRTDRRGAFTLLTYLLAGAARDAEAAVPMHVMLLADGRTAAVLIQFETTSEGEEAAGSLLPGARLLAAECGAQVAFEKVTETSAGYTVRFVQKHIAGLPGGS